MFNLPPECIKNSSKYNFAAENQDRSTLNTTSLHRDSILLNKDLNTLRGL